MEGEFTINSFTGRNKAVEILQKIDELKDLLFEFGFYETDDLSLDKLEEELYKEVLKFEKSKL
jgi:hypothetical protein